MRSTCIIWLAAVLATGTATADQGWPQFRGPKGDGTSTAKRVPLRWSETNNLTWKTDLPGRGRSGPVAIGDRIWLTTALEQGTQRVQIKHDDMQTAEHVSLGAVGVSRKSGNILWHTTLFEVEKPPPVHWFNSWATPTPIAESGRLYCDFGAFGTACLDAKTGKALWKTCLPIDHQVGPGSSPVLWRDLLIVVRDGRDAQFVAALDKRSGKQVWKTERPPIETRSPDLKKSFVTPLLIGSGKQAQLVSPAAHWVVGYEPATGQELWRLRHGDGFSIGSCPVFGHGLAVFSTGCFKAQFVAVRTDGHGDVTASHVAWKTMRQVPILSSPVMAGNELYWVSDEGMASCANAHTGELYWQERLEGQFFASPIQVMDRIYFFARDGKTTVVKAGKQFEKIAENQIEGPVVATPAILDGAILLRTDSHLYCIGNK